jgi:5S rRNA maturation endonuclease (ribonuclease M5)
LLIRFSQSKLFHRTVELVVRRRHNSNVFILLDVKRNGSGINKRMLEVVY